MSIYDNPLEYAKTVRIPVALAKRWCAHQIEVEKKIEQARICPKCGNPALVWESGSYEESTSDYIYCEFDGIPAVDVDGEEYFEECDYVSDPENIHEPLAHWYDFDVILAMHSTREHEFSGLKGWIDFARREVDSILRVSAPKSTESA